MLLAIVSSLGWRRSDFLPESMMNLPASAPTESRGIVTLLWLFPLVVEGFTAVPKPSLGLKVWLARLALRSDALHALSWELSPPLLLPLPKLSLLSTAFSRPLN